MVRFRSVVDRCVLILVFGLVLATGRQAEAQRAMPDAAPIQNFNPLCDSSLVHCLEIDHFAGHVYGHLQVLPKTDHRDSAAVFPFGATLGLFGRVAGGISTYYAFWRETDGVLQQLGPLRLSLTVRLLPLFSSDNAADMHSSSFQLGLAYEHEVRVGPFSGANSLGLLMDLSSLQLVGSKWLGPFYLSASAGALFDWRGSFATGSIAGQLGWVIPGFKQLKVFVGVLGRGLAPYIKKDALPLLPDGHDPIRRQGVISGGFAFRAHRRVDLGVEVQHGFGDGIAPWAVNVSFLVISGGKEHEGHAVTPVAQLAADVAVEAAKAVKDFIESLPIDPKLDEDCVILDDDGSVMGRFGKRTKDRYYCEQDGFRVPIGHILLRDKKGDRLCRDTQKLPTTGKRDLADCLLQRHGKDWVPVHRPRLDGSCRMTDSDGTVLGYIGEPTADGKRCRYAGEKANGSYSKYTRDAELPIGEEFYTDGDRTAVCVDAALRHCFLRSAKGQHSLAWDNGARATTALVGNFENGLSEQVADAKDAAGTARDIATGKVKLSTIYEEGKHVAQGAVDGAADLINNPTKRKAAVDKAKSWVERLETAVGDWARKPPEQQMEDALGAAGKGGSYLATGVAVGGVGRITGEGVSAVAGVGKSAEAAEHKVAGAVKAERKVAQAAQVAAEANVSGAVPELGRKLDYFLGRATGDAHNIERSKQMLAELERIGLPDMPATRQHLTEHLTDVLNDPSNILRVQENGRVLRESALAGPRGVVKVDTIWEGNKLITAKIYGGPR